MSADTRTARVSQQSHCVGRVAWTRTEVRGSTKDRDEHCTAWERPHHRHQVKECQRAVRPPQP